MPWKHLCCLNSNVRSLCAAVQYLPCPHWPRLLIAPILLWSVRICVCVCENEGLKSIGGKRSIWSNYHHIYLIDLVNNGYFAKKKKLGVN